MPFSHLITLISNAHILLLALAARAISRYRPSCDGLPRQTASAWSAPTQCVPLHHAASLLSWPNDVRGMSIDLLERPVFIEIYLARSVAVKLLPAPCRGVVTKSSAHECALHGSQPGVSLLHDVVDNPLRGIRSLSMDGNGGAYRDRTDDILLAKQALSQLS